MKTAPFDMVDFDNGFEEVAKLNNINTTDQGLKAPVIVSHGGNPTRDPATLPSVRRNHSFIQLLLPLSHCEPSEYQEQCEFAPCTLGRLDQKLGISFVAWYSFAFRLPEFILRQVHLCRRAGHKISLFHPLRNRIFEHLLCSDRMLSRLRHGRYVCFIQSSARGRDCVVYSSIREFGVPLI